MQAEKLCEGYGLVEGPVWQPSRGLLFSDVIHGGVFRLAQDGHVENVFEHRRGIGGMCLHAAGGVVVSGRNLACKPFDGGESVTLLDRDEAAGRVGFNDLTTDDAGRIYAGSLGSSPVFEDGLGPRAGDLWLIDLDGSARIVAPDVLLTNGLGFAPDGRTLYHSDSRRHTVFSYDVATDGSLGPKQVFVEPGRGIPDGLAVAVDGSVWVALADGGHGVAVYDADGRERDFVEIAVPMCTSVCFGGEDLRDLYIVSGSHGMDSERAGGVYRVRVEVAGLPVAPARVALPALG
ncbi:MAG: SMP-30/gluconolactonase/LRE family protein [Gammaproteobacteria bacterium]